MKKYEDIVGELNLFTDLNDAAIARFVKEVDALAQIREQYPYPRWEESLI